MDFQISQQEEPSADELQVLEDGIARYTETHIGVEDRREVVFFLRDSDGLIVGGVKGSYGKYGWLWVDSLWVSNQIRGRGFGAQLLTHIERKAIEDGCTNAYLNSFSFQAVEFYKKQGYQVFGELKDFPPGYSVCCLKKDLE
jgi:GNAT superfamily N-acetyltransferase